jgi:hypothetical protein
LGGACTTPGVCPPSCTTNTDCGRCAMPGETGTYCCMSGLCLSMPGACGVPDSGVTDTGVTDSGATDSGTSVD